VEANVTHATLAPDVDDPPAGLDARLAAADEARLAGAVAP
jgi:hypothetical protein